MKSLLLSVKPKYVDEIWKDIPNYEGLYLISNYGRIVSLPRNTTKGKLLTPQLNIWGYYVQALTKNGKHKLCRINRLVALTFIPNPNNYEQVNHINGIKTDNRVCNLEWCSRSHNQKEAYRLGLQIPTEHQKRVAREYCLKEKSIKVKATKLAFTKIYNSMSEASRELGISTSCISRVVNGKRKQANGYKFEVAL